MKILLDTHILLWIAYEEEKLSSKVRALLTDENNEVYISVISVWEINLKYAIGKLELKDQSPSDFFHGFNAYFNCPFLDLKAEEIIDYHTFKVFHHKGPFDRMLIWQAIQNDMLFVSNDEHIFKYTDCGLKVIW